MGSGTLYCVISTLGGVAHLQVVQGQIIKYLHDMVKHKRYGFLHGTMSCFK